MPQAESSPDTPRRRTWPRVAFFAAIALIVLGVFATVARRTFLRHEADITTLIDDSAGIAPSSPVLLNGIDEGHVVRVALSGSPDPNKTVRITMRFPRRVLSEIPRDSTAAITSGNLLGDKYINISRGKDPQHVEPGGEIASSPTQDIGTALGRANAPLNQINTILGHIDKILGYIDSQQGTLGKFMNDPSFQKRLTAVSANGTQLLKDVANGHGVLGRLHEIADEAARPMARLSSIEEDMDHGNGSLGKFLNDPYTPTLGAEVQASIDEAKQLIADFNAGNRTTDLIDRIHKTGGKLDATVARIDAGQGTVGQLIVNPQLRDSLHRVTDELKRITTDIGKHPTRFVQIRFGLF